MKKSADVDAYVATFPKETSARLTKIRNAIRRAAPRAIEGISYRMPSYRQNGVLVYFAGFRQHIGLYPPVRGDVSLVKAAKPYAGPKGNLKFPHGAPLPLTLVARIVRARVKQDDAKKRGK